jgi:hypothetical protein
LVVSGRIARQQGQQRRLLEVLSAAGADPQGALRSPLGESELEAAQVSTRCGRGAHTRGRCLSRSTAGACRPFPSQF